MLFVRRDFKDAPGQNLGQRFANQIGRYLTASNDDQGHRPAPIDIPACYALIGEKNSHIQYDELNALKLTIQQIIGSYHTRTDRWLNQEQIAFAAIWHDTKRQAVTLKEQFKHLDTSLSTLQHNGSTSLLRLSLLAQALQVTQFNTTNTHSMPVKPSRSSRVLNLPLDQTNMADLEAIGRELRRDCEQDTFKRGISLEDTEACWRLKLRYEGCDHILILKCMPIAMLREVFESQHLQKYGTTDENRTVIIDELVIEIRLTDTGVSGTPESSVYVEQWLSQWQQYENNPATFHSKWNDKFIQKQFSWLFCPILDDILAKRMTKQTDSAMPEFFLTIHQKNVDEIIMRN